MADGIYVSMCGAVARADQLEAVADNLANAQTPGFKASRPAFEAFMAPSGAQDKAYTAAVATAFDLRPGPTNTTGNPLDVLPEDGAFLTVLTPEGATGYTRDGRLTLDGDRRLVSDGRLVLSREGKPIQIPPERTFRIDAHGKVWVQGLPEERQRIDHEVAQLALVKLEGAVDRIGPTLLAPGRTGRAVPVESGVRVGEIELGNTSALEATLSLVSAQRSYDASMQAIQTYRQLDQRAVELGRIR